MMKNVAEILSAVIALGGTMVRRGKENFVAIPLEDGTFAKVAVGNLLAKDTATNKAFDFDSACTDYILWAREQEIKKEVKAVKPVNTEAQARRDAMDATITAWIPNMEQGKRYSATEIKDAIGIEVDVMQVGSSAIRLADNGIIGVEKDAKGKRFYFAL